MHPMHKETHGHKRADHLLKGYARGGKVHGDEAEDRALFKKMIAQHEKGEGEKAGGRIHGKKAHRRMDKRARGGAVKKKPGTVVNVMVGHPRPAVPMAAGPGPMLPPPGGPMPPAGPMMGPPPMAGLPGGAPPMKRGGRVKHLGEAINRTAKMAREMSNKKHFRSGGRVKSYPKMEYGSLTGLGREEKIRKYGSNAKS